jgi:hypothetical protein
VSATQSGLPANSVLRDEIGHLLKTLGRATTDRNAPLLSQLYYQLSGAELEEAETVSWAEIEWRPGELYPRFGIIATNLSRPAERIVAFYN